VEYGLALECHRRTQNPCYQQYIVPHEDRSRATLAKQEIFIESANSHAKDRRCFRVWGLGYYEDITEFSARWGRELVNEDERANFPSSSSLDVILLLHGTYLQWPKIINAMPKIGCRC
jgi:hypothetical protein